MFNVVVLNSKSMISLIQQLITKQSIIINSLFLMDEPYAIHPIKWQDKTPTEKEQKLNGSPEQRAHSGLIMHKKLERMFGRSPWYARMLASLPTDFWKVSMET